MTHRLLGSCWKEHESGDAEVCWGRAGRSASQVSFSLTLVRLEALVTVRIGGILTSQEAGVQKVHLNLACYCVTFRSVQ